MSKTLIKVLVILGVLLVLGAIAFGVFGYLLPYLHAENTMPAGDQLTLYEQEDGTVKLVWPAGTNTTRYLVEVLEPVTLAQTTGDETTEPPQPVVLYSAFVEGATEHIMPALPEDVERTIRISSVTEYDFPFEEEPRTRYGEVYMEVTGVFEKPKLWDLVWEPDPDADTVSIWFAMPENGTSRLYFEEADGTRTEAMELTSGEVTLSFGEEEAFPMPTDEEDRTFCLDVYTQLAGCTYYGQITGSFTVNREDLLGRELHMQYAEDGENQYLFTWGETKGDYYALQCYDPDALTWNDVAQIQRNEELSCFTGRLEPFSEYKFRVVAVGGQTLPDSEFAAISEEVTVKTESSLVYSTIWPIKDLDIYADPQKTQVIGTATKATAYCVLGEKEGMFQIGMKESYGYIDSNYCMINLPDYIGDLCYYDITNSYSSKYKAHDYDIDGVTGKLIGGYEDVRIGQGKYLVPLLYPTAQKLIDAAQLAREKGYVLKIYDSFRPQKATKSLYDQAIDLMEEPIPDQEEGISGRSVTLQTEQPPSDPTEQTQPPTEETQPPTEQTQPPTEETQPPTEETQPPTEPVPEEEEEDLITYGEYMTDNGRYNMSAFLAAGYSQHNRGVALDLTIVDLATGVELKMQTDMHDLTWYSELAKNNRNANTLFNIMKQAGFGGLASEWWHFQDNAAIKNLKLPYLWNGVSLKGWTVDDYGWRYRDANGAYYTDCVKEIDGVQYTFDIYGYVIEEVQL